MSEELTGKVALVTGAGKGMGQATAQMLASHGAFVAVADIDGAAGMAVVEVIRSSGGQAEFIEVDVACSQQVSAMIASTVRVFGRLDVAVNNAAVMPDDSPTSDIDEDLWDRIIGVNLRGTMLCLKYELQQMLKQGSGGSIVNLSSVLGFRPYQNAPAYVAAKHAVHGLTKNAALENGSNGIRVNEVAPGSIDTPMLRRRLSDLNISPDDYAPTRSLLNRLGRPDEVAEAVLWLASSRSSYVTGSVIHVDAGYVNAR
ncbi:MAG: SDR family NAD(P)-dependent oxidoreductase [Candidatus Nanopelagicales bacterium]